MGGIPTFCTLLFYQVCLCAAGRGLHRDHFNKLSENSKGPWISKNLSHSFIKRFQKKTLEGIWAQPLPLLQNHYPITPLHKSPFPPPSPPNQF